MPQIIKKTFFDILFFVAIFLTFFCQLAPPRTALQLLKEKKEKHASPCTVKRRWKIVVQRN
jgi:hypothetical protein